MYGGATERHINRAHNWTDCLMTPFRRVSLTVYRWQEASLLLTLHGKDHGQNDFPRPPR